MSNMTDQDRVMEIIEISGRLLDAWLDAPELRLGQLMENLTKHNPNSQTPSEESGCVFGTLDEVWLERLGEWRKRF